MKKVIILIVLTALFALGYFVIDYRPLKDIPENVLNKANVIWNTKMIEGVGVYYTNGTERPAISDDKDLYSEDPRQAIYGKSGIIINFQLYNGYVSFKGGQIDIVKGPMYSYELYGRVVGQYIIPHRFAWNNEYHYSYTDYYLLKRNKDTGYATLVRMWGRSTAQYGSLQYDHNKNILHIKLCGADDDSMTVDIELYEDEKLPIIQCTK